MSPVATTSPARTTVVAARRLATEEWSRLLGDVSACTLAKDGNSHPAAKFHEGRVAALGELARRLVDGTDHAGAAGVAADIGARWAEKAMPGGPLARDWAAYRAGGLQALTDIAVELTPPRYPDGTRETTQ